MRFRLSTLLQRLYRIKIHHVAIWAGYFGFWILFYKGYYSNIWHLFFVTTIYFIFNASSFYLTAYYLLPAYLNKRKYGAFALYLLIIFGVFSTGLATCIYAILRYNSMEAMLSKFGILQISFLSILTTVGGLTAAKLVVEKIRTDRLHQRLDRERIETELQYLKAQVNPHFLFNAINSVYFLIKKDPNKGADNLIKLSDLLRFQLYDCSTDAIDIEKEIANLENYISLEQLRKGKKVDISFHRSGELSGFQIAPFLLLPFLENTFKHVSTTHMNGNTITIELIKEEDNFKARFSNTIEPGKEALVGGIGLKNVMRRLELLYPARHTITIHSHPATFEAILTLTLT